MIVGTKLSNLSIIAVVLGLSACAKNSPPPTAPLIETKATAPEPAPLATPSSSMEESFVEGVAGGVMVSTIKLQAEVLSVDQKLRHAVLRGPKGNEVMVRVGRGAVNFYQLAAGDRVDVTIKRELVIYVADDREEAQEAAAQDGAKPDASAEKVATQEAGEQEAVAQDGAKQEVTTQNSAPADGVEVVAMGAEEGEAPAGVVVASSRVTSTIAAIDIKARTATLTFKSGRVETYDIRPDVDLANYKVGQEVVFLMTEMLALDVEKL